MEYDVPQTTTGRDASDTSAIKALLDLQSSAKLQTTRTKYELMFVFLQILSKLTMRKIIDLSNRQALLILFSSLSGLWFRSRFIFVIVYRSF